MDHPPPRQPFPGATLRSRSSPDTRQRRVDVVCFGRYGQWYGIPAHDVAGIVPNGSMTPAPDATPPLVGELSHQGETIPVVDLSRWSEREPKTPTPDEMILASCFVIIGRGEHRTALQSDGVACILDADPAVIQPHMDSVRQGQPYTFTEALTVQGQPVILLQVDSLLRQLRAKLAAAGAAR